jgi:hypothetical protein
MTTAAAPAARPAFLRILIRLRKFFSRLPLHLVLIAIGLLWMTPTIGLLVSSFRPATEVSSTGWWMAFQTPFKFTLDNYHAVISQNGMGRSFLNSLIITIPGTVIPILVASFAGFAFAWMKFPGRNLLFIFLVALIVVPIQATLIPVLRLFADTHLVGTFPGIWLAHTAYGLPFAIFLLTSFFGSLPKELLESEVWPLVEQFLSDRGLRLSPEKTRITHISQGFDFLGQHLRKFDGKLVIQPSKKNTHAFLEKVRRIIDANQSVSQTLLIGLLNPVIRGWANYHRHCAAKDTFNRVDHEIWRALWQWARRQHLKKSRDWVKKHCFPALRNRAWTFATQTGQRTPGGQPIWMRLVYAGETIIRRHVKVRRHANPFDPQWKSYFVERAFHKKFGIHRQEAGIKPS